MNPVATGFIVFPDNLMEAAVFEDELKVLATFFDGWQVNVGSFSQHVLTVAYASYCCIEFGRTIVGADGNRLVHPFAQGFKNLATEILKVAYYLQ